MINQLIPFILISFACCSIFIIPSFSALANFYHYDVVFNYLCLILAITFSYSLSLIVILIAALIYLFIGKLILLIGDFVCKYVK